MASGLEREAEKFRIRGLKIEDLLNPQFVKSLRDNNIEFIPFLLSLDLTSEKEIVTINHENQKEVKENIIHIDSKTQHVLEKFSKVLDDFKKI